MQECAVVGSQHPDLGQEVSAVVVVTPGATVTEEELREFASERCPTSRCRRSGASPRTCLPRNATGR
ncbi:hypothetical protein GS495_14140 [Rhodococcus hoagii]|nr:hypothetical protein [Prescottella equi]